ncbi:hypothetical protein V1264_025135 [Littorina saxatilis]|uniref:Uncharacterized protein n=1 Tax=Littorina saxatilis TaxID=31220 RepID=A0AAN9ALI5_9CAEN
MKFAVVVVLLAVAFCGEVSSRRPFKPLQLQNCNMVACFVDPCFYTKCSSGYRCQSCNCRASCVPWPIIGR